MSLDIKLTEVTKNTVMGSHENGRSNAGAVILNDFIVAIDCTMWPHTARLFRQALEEKYRKPVKYLFVTHSHGDHVMGLSAFKDITIFSSYQLPNSLRKRLQIQWSPKQMQEMKGSGMAPPEWIEEVEFMIPPVVFHDGMEIINADQQIEFRFSGGHSDDSSWAYYANEKVLFAGDLIFANCFPFAGDDTCNPETWIAVLDNWLEMPIEKVVPGHGPIMGLDAVEQTLTFFKQLKQNTLDAIAKKKSQDDIIIPDIYETNDDISWLVNKTLNHWYKYYTNNSKLAV